MARSLNTLDEQASGWRDDGSESGIQRVEVAAGNLVPVPFRLNNCNIAQSGTVTVSNNAVNTANFDGTATGLIIIAPAAAALGGGARIAFFFNGPVLALRYHEILGYTLPDMSMNIDGVNYPIPTSQSRDPITNALPSAPPAEMQMAMISRDLGDGPHFAEIFINQSKTDSCRMYLHGYLVDEAAGYARPLPGVKCGPAQIAVSTSYGGILSGNSVLAAVRKLLFANTTASPITVSVRPTSTASAMWSRPVPANDTLELDFGGLAYDLGTIQVSASATGVTCTLIGVQ